MSEEEYSEEEVEVEEDTEEVSVKQPIETKRSRERIDATGADDDNLNEAEKAMLASKRRIEDDDNAKLQDYEEKRRVEREREEEELRLLKEKQEQRRLQREEEEREQEERRKAEEERRKQEEEERKAKIEADRKKKEEDKKKRHQAMMGVGFASTPTGGRNFTLPEKKKDQINEKFGNIVQAKQEMGMTKDQREEAKKVFIGQVLRNMGDLASLGGPELKGKIKEMHHRICKLEAEKYDLEKRLQTQEYDLKELNERQRQINRAKMKDKGMDPNSANSRFPPKVAIFSKYDRQIDRRNFIERRSLYDKKNAFPCFPNVPPPPTILVFKPLPEDGMPKSPGIDGADGGAEMEEDGEEEEEE